MDEYFYKQLTEESSTGYAYHRIICDKDGAPCDYEFIEVNAAFEALTGLKRFDIVSRKVTEVLPDRFLFLLYMISQTLAFLC